MITIYYENSRGEILDFLKYPYCTAEADCFDSDWTESSTGYQRTVQVDVYGNDIQLKANMERLYSIIAVDAEENTYGRLYVNDTFLRCRIQASKKLNWEGYVYSEVELIFTAPELAWTAEVKRQFLPSQDAEDDAGLDFEYEYPFDFASDEAGVTTWDIEHVTASDFEMILYGPCVNPYVIINGHTYTVYTDLEAGEYLVIDSRAYTATKYLSNGTTQNMFNERGLADSIFEKIPSGLLRINWSGDVGFDLTLFLKRREARW